VPPREHPHFDQWALAQLRLYKPHYSLYELCFPSVLSVFDVHVLADGFPNIDSHPASAPADSVSDDNKLPCEPDLLRPAPLETEVQQDDYHELMNIGRTRTSHQENSLLLFSCLFDILKDNKDKKDKKVLKEQKSSDKKLQK
jgi:hypothetical protein